MAIFLAYRSLGTLTHNVALIPVALGASGGTAPYVYALAAAPIAAPAGNESALNNAGAGALPFGLSLDGVAGIISGAPLVAGDYQFSVVVTDALGASASFEFSGSVVRNASIIGNNIDPASNNSTSGVVPYRGIEPDGGHNAFTVSLGGNLFEIKSGQTVTGMIPAFEKRRLQDAGLLE